jgi:hypothetical protein
MVVSPTLLKRYINLIKRFDPRVDDTVIIKRFDRFSDILKPNEKILWQGTPSARHAWGDHDQMEPAGSVGERPVSLWVRKPGHWEYDIDFTDPPWFKINAVGFLSVPDARRVMTMVERAVR